MDGEWRLREVKLLAQGESGVLLGPEWRSPASQSRSLESVKDVGERLEQNCVTKLENEIKQHFQINILGNVPLNVYIATLKKKL